MQADEAWLHSADAPVAEPLAVHGRYFRYRRYGGRRCRGEQSDPPAEEPSKVRKRVHERGSAHVRTYVREVPVEEPVCLRERRLSVEPLAQTVTGADAEALLRARDIDVATL